MATPETPSVELDPVPSHDGPVDAAENQENQIVEADTRELPVYGFDSDDKTLVGIGGSDSVDSIRIRHFDSSDRTLAGIGPTEQVEPPHVELAEQVVLDESASHSLQAEAAPQSSSMPLSEPPGPFIASDHDDDTAALATAQKGKSRVFVLSGLLVAAAAFALLRGVVPRRHTAEPRVHAAAVVAPQLTANETPPPAAPFQRAAAASAEPGAVELPITQVPSAPEFEPVLPPATIQREKEPEPVVRRVTAKVASAEPLGILDVTSNSPSGLVLDGRPLGKAPRVVQLPPGPHTVLFIHPERGRMSVTVNVRAGRTTVASADF